MVEEEHSEEEDEDACGGGLVFWAGLGVMVVEIRTDRGEA